jgi:hypothetical protein
VLAPKETHKLHDLRELRELRETHEAREARELRESGQKYSSYLYVCVSGPDSFLRVSATDVMRKIPQR